MKSNYKEPIGLKYSVYRSSGGYYIKQIKYLDENQLGDFFGNNREVLDEMDFGESVCVRLVYFLRLKHDDI